MTRIHSTAIISSIAHIGRRTTIGPFSIIEDDVVIGDDCQLAAQVVVKRGTTIGQRNLIHEAAVLGGRPQHAKAPEQVGSLTIGNGNTIRESVTMHCALEAGDSTYVGHNNFMMVGVHVAHDCRIADHVIIANNTLLAGHTIIDHHAYLSGAVGTHQFVRIGQYVMVGGQAHIKQDVPPFVTVDGYSSQIVGLNLIGLRRNGFSGDEIKQLKAAYRVIYRSGLERNEVLETLQTRFIDGPAAAFYPFLSTSQRGVIQARQPPQAAKRELPLHPHPSSQGPIRRAA